MNEATWIISPNWLVWILLSLIALSLLSIAIHHWARDKEVKNKATLMSWISIVLSLVAVVCVFLKTEDSNNASMIVTALGVMVTALVGWQVFNAIENVKTLKRMDRMQTAFAHQHQLLETQDKRGRNLIEAFAEARKGDAESILSAKYMCYLNSIHLFISANVPAAYQYLTQAELELSNTLNLLEHSTDHTSQRMFIDHINDYENIYRRIMTLIHQRQEDLDTLHIRITRLRDERRRVCEALQKIKFTIT